MSDAIGSLLGMPKPETSTGGVYDHKLPDGSTVYFPAAHADAGTWLAFPSRQEAASAARLDLPAATSLQLKSAKGTKARGMAGKIITGEMSMQDISLLALSGKQPYSVQAPTGSSAKPQAASLLNSGSPMTQFPSTGR